MSAAPPPAGRDRRPGRLRARTPAKRRTPTLLPADLDIDLRVLRGSPLDIDDAHGLIRSLQQEVIVAEGHELAPGLRHRDLVPGNRTLSVGWIGANHLQTFYSPRARPINEKRRREGRYCGSRPRATGGARPRRPSSPRTRATLVQVPRRRSYPASSPGPDVSLMYRKSARQGRQGPVLDLRDALRYAARTQDLREGWS